MNRRPYPVFIITYNLVSTTKRMVEDILRMGGQPIIIDNASTYPPLLDWYDSLKNNKDVHLVRLPGNFGPHFIYHNLLSIRKTYSGLTGKKLPPEFFITDCDLDLSEIPDDGIDVLYRIYDACKSQKRIFLKIGFGLRIDDLPVVPHLLRTITWESQFYKSCEKVSGIKVNAEAKIDTTFHLYDSTLLQRARNFIKRNPVQIDFYSPAIRTYAPYVARHIPWYWEKEKLGEEETYYLQHINPSLSTHSADIKRIFNL